MQDSCFHYSVISNKGLVRETNQDAIAAYVYKNIGLFVVADGMGGHAAGEKASATIIEKMDIFWKAKLQEEFRIDFMDWVRDIRFAIEEANKEIFMNYNQDQVCGSTIVAVLVYGIHFATFSVGDSRIYSVDKFKINQLSVDDVWDNLIDVKAEFTEEEIKNHKNHGKLLNAVGIDKKIKINVTIDNLKKNQKLILCSDGLYKYCDEKYIGMCLALARNDKAINKATEKIFNKVIQNGARDNVSFIIVAPIIE